MKSLKIKVCGMRDAENIAELIELPIDYIGFIFYEKSPRYVALMPQLINSNKFKKINKVGVFVNADIDFVLNKITQFDLNTIQLHGEETPQYLIDLRNKINEFTSNKLNPMVNSELLIADKLELSSNELQLNNNELQLNNNELQLNNNELQLNSNELQLNNNELQLNNNQLELSGYQLEVQINDSKLINSELKISIWKAFSIDEQFNFDNTKPYESIADALLFDTKTPQHGGSGQKFNWDLLQNYQGKTPFFLSGGISASDTEGVKSVTHPEFSGLDLNSKFEISPAFKDVELLKKFIDTIHIF